MFYYNILKNFNMGGVWPMIVVDSVVGAGKSSLMKILEEEGFISFPEPVIDNPLLEKFYHNRERYSFPLQIFFLNRRFKHIKEASKLENSIMDRSIYGDVIFARMLYENGEMSNEEFNLYIELFENMIQHCHPPKLMIYLECSVDLAMKRIKKRGRSYELIVEREYWERLNKNYREYFAEYNFSPILRINIDNIDFENNIEDREYILGLIREKLKTL